MLTLYGSRGSGSAAAEMALTACRAPYSLVQASRWQAGSTFDELQKINPLGQIPTLVLDDGTVLTESAAIQLHLALAYPAAGLLPQDPSARAQSLRGLVFITANCYAAISVIDYPERWCDEIDEATKLRINSAARRRLHRAWVVFADQFADQFAGQPFLSGTEPGALDFLAVVVSSWAGSRAHLKAERPSFCATLLRIEAHERVAPVMKAHFNR